MVNRLRSRQVSASPRRCSSPVGTGQRRAPQHHAHRAAAIRRLAADQPMPSPPPGPPLRAAAPRPAGARRFRSPRFGDDAATTATAAFELTGRTRQVTSSCAMRPDTRSRALHIDTRHTGAAEPGLTTCTSSAPRSCLSASDRAPRISSPSNGELQRSEYRTCPLSSPVRTINCGWSAWEATLTPCIPSRNGAGRVAAGTAALGPCSV